MAGNLTFHNKFHRANHHSLSSIDLIDSGFDPIATERFPFLGTFYNTITDNRRTFRIDTNSLEWWSGFTTMLAFSGNWMPTLTLYTTVCSLSDDWNLGYSGYTTLRGNSGRYDSVYTTVNTFSADWGSPFLMFTNKVQEYTHSKTFSAQNLTPVFEESNLYEWDLNSQQVGILILDKDSIINNPVEDTMINGGMYTLIVKQKNNGVQNLGHNLQFGAAYRFNERFSLEDNEVIINRSLSGITIINFLAVEGLMYGDVIFLSGNY
jgi:hypothetical protein